MSSNSKRSSKLESKVLFSDGDNSDADSIDNDNKAKPKIEIKEFHSDNDDYEFELFIQSHKKRPGSEFKTQIENNTSNKKRKICTTTLSPTNKLTKKQKISRNNTHDIKPFWNKKISKTVTNNLPIELNNDTKIKWLHKGTSKMLMKNSWFCTTRNRFAPLDNEEWIQNTLSRQITISKSNNDNHIKTIKYRVYPTKEQKEKLAKWFGVVRWTYNKCVHYIRKHKLTDPSRQILRDKFVKN